MIEDVGTFNNKQTRCAWFTNQGVQMRMHERYDYKNSLYLCLLEIMPEKVNKL